MFILHNIIPMLGRKKIHFKFALPCAICLFLTSNMLSLLLTCFFSLVENVFKYENIELLYIICRVASKSLNTPGIIYFGYVSG